MTFQFTTFLFLLVALLAYYISAPKYRPFVLMMASWGYIVIMSRIALVIMLAVSVFTYIIGFLIHRFQNGRQVLSRLITILGVVGCASSLCILKLGDVLRTRDHLPSFLSWTLIPIGFSYYIFQSISFLVDINRVEIAEFPSIIDFFLYQSFFAKFISGPIERGENFFSQKKAIYTAKFFNEENLNRSFSYILYGFCMKLILANRFAKYTEILLNNPDFHSSKALIAGSLMYTLQIYTDFAGYSSIAIGIALLFGIKLTQNFKAPYTAKSMSDFWRRWHISLSNWLRDYIYIPLGGNRKGAFRKHLNTIVVFFICGLWHGNGLNFVVWGLMHGFLSVIDNILEKAHAFDAKVMQIVRRILVFISVSIAWLFFGIDSVSRALTYIKNMFIGSGVNMTVSEEMSFLELSSYQLWIMIIGVLVMIVMDVLSSINKKDFPELLMVIALPARLTVFLGLLVLLLVYGVYGPSEQVISFMYMEF
ncbi:MBOAT family O-acyltransferase [Butyrivibrio sp. WCE2006]|uniref:MBOAT family O-acyltransferase n=1 Tax=Butyrivibrio sp. WCE2006 TaxID=1410611 RepID=UPI0005D18353|nr:MBOAT family O-acyltransferase [Butyrivibrio sp. WCE2006]